MVLFLTYQGTFPILSHSRCPNSSLGYITMRRGPHFYCHIYFSFDFLIHHVPEELVEDFVQWVFDTF